MNRRTALRSLAAAAPGSFAGLTAGCLGGSEDATDTPEDAGTTIPGESPAERVEWASIGLETVSFESLTEDDVRVTATVEIRNPTAYRIPVHTVSYTVLSGRGESFEAFARGHASGCGVVDFFGENRTFLDYVREAGLPCPPEATPTFVVDPRDTTSISLVARPQTPDQTEVANRLLDVTDPVYVRVDGEAVLWNTNVDVDFETETALRPP